MSGTGNALLDLALRAALAAGVEIMRVYAEPFEVRQKLDKTPVTEADLAAERIIEQILREALPDIPVVSEETAEPEGWTAPGPRFWSVDPLDGTREFVNHTDEFAVNIGLVENGRAVLGVVYGPAIGVTHAAADGKAMRRRGSGDFETIAARKPPPDGIVVVHSRSHENSQRLAEYFAEKSVPILERKKCGSALKFGVLASGEADFYPRFGTTMEWDTAAGQAILEAAGGSVVTIAGTPLVYGKPGLKNEGFLAWGKKPAW